MKKTHDMDLRKLRNATVLATERNFSRAAEKLNLTQSALSRSISNLEQELGLRLFDRNPGDIAVTTAGKEFIDGANRLLRHARGLSHDMSLLRDGFTGNVAFGMGPYPAAALLQDALTELVKQHPGLNVRVEVTTPEQLLEHLTAEQIEFFIGDARRIKLGQEFIAEALVRLRPSLYVRSDHPLVSLADKDRDLSLYPVVGTPTSQDYTAGSAKWLGIRPDKHFQLQVACDNISILKSLAITTDAILIAPNSAVAAECNAGVLKELQAPGILARKYADFDIVRLANRSLSPAAKVIFEILGRLAKDCV